MQIHPPRLLDSRDIPTLQHIQETGFETVWTDKQWLQRLEHKRQLLFGLDGQDSLIGYAVVSYLFEEAELLQICVERDYRGAGMASVLLDEVLKKLKSMGVERCLLEVRESNTSAQRLYLKLGFAVDGKRKGYYPAANGREDAVLMSCEI